MSTFSFHFHKIYFWFSIIISPFDSMMKIGIKLLEHNWIHFCAQLHYRDLMQNHFTCNFIFFSSPLCTSHGWHPNKRWLITGSGLDTASLAEFAGHKQIISDFLSHPWHSGSGGVLHNWVRGIKKEEFSINEVEGSSGFGETESSYSY